MATLAELLAQAGVLDPNAGSEAELIRRMGPTLGPHGLQPFRPPQALSYSNPELVEQPAAMLPEDGGGLLGRLGQSFGPSPFHAQADLSAPGGGIAGIIALAAAIANHKVNQALNERGKAQEQNAKIEARVQEINKENRERQATFDENRIKGLSLAAEASRKAQADRQAKIDARAEKEADYLRDSVELPGGQRVPVSSTLGQQFIAKRAGIAEPKKDDDLPNNLTPSQRARLESNKQKFGTRIEQMQRKIAGLERMGKNQAKVDSLRGEIDGVMRQWEAADRAARPTAEKSATGTDRGTLAFYDRAKAAVDDVTMRDEAGSSLEDRMARSPLPAQFWSDKVNDAALTPDQRSYRQSVRAFTIAVLRKESGAAISPQEYKDMADTYFTRAGDGPAMVRQKARSRGVLLSGLRGAAGPAFEEKYGTTADEEDAADKVLEMLGDR